MGDLYEKSLEIRKEIERKDKFKFGLPADVRTNESKQPAQAKKAKDSRVNLRTGRQKKKFNF